MNPNDEPKLDIILQGETHQPTGFSRILNRRFVTTLLIIMAVAALVVWRTAGARKNGSLQFQTREVQRGDLTVTVAATGTLEPTNEVEVGSELSGAIKSVEADYNDTVKVGQILARIDTAKLESQITQAKAALDTAKAKVLQTQATLDETGNKFAQLQKARELSNNKVPSQSELDAAKAAFDRAKADVSGAQATVSEARANLNVAETDFAKATIRSPVNGIVLTRSVEPGQTVAASFQAPVLFTLAEDLTKMELHVDVDEADISRVKEGQTAAFTVDAYPNRTFHAQVTQIRYGSKIVEGVVTYETILKVHNPDLSLRPGMTATAAITIQNIKKAILVPNAALRFTPPVTEKKQASSGGLVGALLPHPAMPPANQNGEIRTGTDQRVWIIRNGQLEAVSLTTGVTDGTMTEVTKGAIQEGMALIIDSMAAGK